MIGIIAGVLTSVSMLSNSFSVLLNSGLLVCYMLFRKKGKTGK